MPPKRRVTANANSQSQSKSKNKSKNKRRKHPSDTPTPDERTPPDPPPAPPSALVRLIQKDSAVLEYFQALQTNLDYDVQKWKTRARNHEREKEELRQESNRWKKEQQQQQHHQQLHQSNGDTDSNQQQSKHSLSNEEEATEECLPLDQGERNDQGAKEPDLPLPDQQQHDASSSPSALQEKDDKGASTVKKSSPEPVPESANKEMDNDFLLEFLSSSEDENDEDDDDETGATKIEVVSKETSKAPTKSSFGIHKANTNDFTLQLSSSDDEDMEIDGKEETTDVDATRNSTAEPFSWKKILNNLSPDLHLAIEQLQMVFETLQELGILLIEKEEIPPDVSADDKAAKQEDATNMSKSKTAPTATGISTNENNSQQDDDGESMSMEPTEENVIPTIRRYTLRRRSDQDVAIDIFQFIKALVRIKHNPNANDTTTSNDQPYYHPFMTTDYLPCYMATNNITLLPDDSENSSRSQNSHPAVKGVERLLLCLCYMDVFSSAIDSLPSELVPPGDSFEEEFADENITNDEQMLQEEEKFRRLALGVKDRKTFVCNLLQSLEGEIVSAWAIQDRSMRLLTTATHHSPAFRNPKEENSNKDAAKAQELSNGGNVFGSKNLIRLAALVERCIHAKIVTTLYLFRQDHNRAFQFVWSYILSTVSAVALEDHPKLPPILSFCALEAILFSSIPSSPNASGIHARPPPYLLHWITKNIIPESNIGRMLQLVWESTADIYRIRNGPDLDDRITDVSRVELAAFERIAKQIPWWDDRNGISNNDTVHNLQEELDHLLTEDQGDGSSAGDPHWIASISLALVALGDAWKVDQISHNTLMELQNKSENGELTFMNQELLLSCVAAKRELELRQLDEYRRIVNMPMHFAPNKTGDRYMQSYSRTWINWLVQQTFDSIVNMLVAALRCCQSCSDAESLCRLIQWTVQQLEDGSSKYSPSYDLLDAMEAASHVVVVRVINLQRRPDRMASCLSQTLAERLVVMKGVVPTIQDSDSTKVDSFDYCFGEHAVDGKGKAAEVERRLLQYVGGIQEDLNALVETHWVPNELKPFDSEAPDKPTLVLISPSEKACALSHVASWKGVERSLSRNDPTTLSPMLRNPMLLQQRFLISGYARGVSLFSTNDGMGPAPVCVILEDDAILVDRFTERLSSLLEELPRDFHFCSLGYSRPKTAPLVPFSSQVAIPTSIWYLTGYILSLEGARYLLNKLPVRGPVDSWIGLAMFTNNWDNVFGNALGVGVSAKPPQDPSITMDNLRKILRFRAFAAAVPLCGQKVGTNSDIPSTGRNWRQKDTDIVYSGT